MDGKTKEELEQKKLELEISALNKPWYKNLEFWKVFIPTFAILTSLYFTFGKGALDNQKDKLEIKREQLRLEILTFELEKTEIVKSIDVSKKELKSTNDDIVNQILISDSLNRELQKVRNEVAEQTKRFKDQSGQLSRDKDFYKKELSKQFNLEKSYLSKLSKLTDSLRNVQYALELRLVELDFYKDLYEIDSIQKSELSYIILEKRSKLTVEWINKYDGSIENLDRIERNIRNRLDTMTSEELSQELELYFLKHMND